MDDLARIDPVSIFGGPPEEKEESVENVFRNDAEEEQFDLEEMARVEKILKQEK